MTSHNSASNNPTTRLPSYTIVPGGKYAAQGRPSYAHVYRDGTLVHQANGSRCLEICQSYVDAHDPIKIAVRQGLLVPLPWNGCMTWPNRCAYAQRPEILCPVLVREEGELAADKRWHYCTGLGVQGAEKEEQP